MPWGLGVSLRAEEWLNVAVPGDVQPAATPLAPLVPGGVPPTAAVNEEVLRADAANLDGCQVIARIDDQIILACDVLWKVNLLIEKQRQKLGAETSVSEEEINAVRKELMKQEVRSLVDRKLLFNQFRRNVPIENWPRIEENLLEPFETHELPQLFKQLNVDNQRDLERELARLGSSLGDVRRAFNERVVATEWIRTKIKVSDEVSPAEMVEYYQAHLKDYDYPARARWEELAVRKNRFASPREAFAALAHMGNEAWQRGTQASVRGAAFAEVAQAKSDGFTAKKGGMHDWTSKGSLQCKAIDEALFSLQVGQMSPILDSGTMFHIVRVLEREEAGRKPYTEVQADIRDQLKDERFRVEMEKYLGKLRADARIWTVFTGHVAADELLGQKPEANQRR